MLWHNYGILLTKIIKKKTICIKMSIFIDIAFWNLYLALKEIFLLGDFFNWGCSSIGKPSISMELKSQNTPKTKKHVIKPKIRKIRISKDINYVIPRIIINIIIHCLPLVVCWRTYWSHMRPQIYLEKWYVHITWRLVTVS